MSSHPLPPPPPLPTDGQQDQSMTSWAPSSQLKRSPAPRRDDATQHEPQSSQLLSSQKFKDELAVKQARLSPNPDSQLSIDDKIRMRKERERARGGDLACEQSARLPDKLVNSSTLQRDKRPFAYSPDVSDPNNRGKLDLSQIKSPIMRRRLMANMEESQDDDDADFIAGTESWADGPSCKSNVKLVSSERVATKLLDTGLQQQQPSYHYLNDSIHKPTATPTPKMLAPIRNDKGAHVQALSNPPIVHYNEPPRFYDIEQANYDTQQPYAPPGKSANHLNTLDAEIAESLEKFSLLANTLDTKGRQSRPQKQPSTNLHVQGRGATHNSGSVGHGENFWPPGASIRQAQPSKVSTFLSDTRDYGEKQGAEQMTTATRFQPQTPSFYSTLPSGRCLSEYCPLGSKSNYFGASSSSSGPYSISPYYGCPLDVDEPAMPTWSRLDSKPTSHRTFCTNQNSSTTSQHNTTSNRGVNGPSGCYHQAHLPSPSTQRQECNTTNTDILNVGSRDDDRVRALCEMTARLEREACRLYDFDLNRGNQ